MSPKLSILMPVFNGEKYITETLDTVVAQTFKDWEVVLMDGGSKDNTVAIAKRYAEQYPNIHIYSEPDEGPYDAIHKALALAKGQYVCVLCASDGYLNNEWLALSVKELDADPELSLVWGIPFDVTEEKKLLGPHFVYAHFLKGAHARGPFFKEMLGRLLKPSSLMRLLKKVNKANLAAAKNVIAAKEPPVKQGWFQYWLETGTIVPDGNMCLDRRVFAECLPPYRKGTREPGDWMGFFFNVNAHGYLSKCLPIPANYTRRVQEGSVTQRMVAYNDANRREYFEKLAELRKHPESVKFRDRAGNVIQ